MNINVRGSKNLVAIRYSLQDYEKQFRDEFENALNRSGISITQTPKLMRVLKTVFQQFKTRRFAVNGQLEIYQYPLMSLSASGKFNDRELGTIVYVKQTSLRRAYQRKWVIPRDPKTDQQLVCRERMRLMNQQWKLETKQTREIWNQAAKKCPVMTGKNLYARCWFQYVQTHQTPPNPGFLPEDLQVDVNDSKKSVSMHNNNSLPAVTIRQIMNQTMMMNNRKVIETTKQSFDDT